MLAGMMKAEIWLSLRPRTGYAAMHVDGLLSRILALAMLRPRAWRASRLLPHMLEAP